MCVCVCAERDVCLCETREVCAKEKKKSEEQERTGERGAEEKKQRERCDSYDLKGQPVSAVQHDRGTHVRSREATMTSGTTLTESRSKKGHESLRSIPLNSTWCASHR